jgi:hypothetical protein
VGRTSIHDHQVFARPITLAPGQLAEYSHEFNATG